MDCITQILTDLAKLVFAAFLYYLTKNVAEQEPKLFEKDETKIDCYVRAGMISLFAAGFASCGGGNPFALLAVTSIICFAGTYHGLRVKVYRRHLAQQQNSQH